MKKGLAKYISICDVYTSTQANDRVYVWARNANALAWFYEGWVWVLRRSSVYGCPSEAVAGIVVGYVAFCIAFEFFVFGDICQRFCLLAVNY